MQDIVVKLNNMILIIGLGNPGQKYENTPHNIGRLVLSSWQEAVNFSDFSFKKNFNAFISENNFEGEKIILALPETFMNNSGSSVKALAANYKLTAEDIWVVHDDIDLPLGKIKIVKNRGAAGHKGIESIIKILKTKNFIRFRIGIKPKPYTLNPKILTKFVLQQFNKENKEIVKEIIKTTIEAIEFSLKEGIEKAMNKFNE